MAAAPGLPGAPAAAARDAPEPESEPLRRGIDLFREGDVERAEPLLREALRRDPDDPVAHFYLGQLLLTRHRLDEAEKHFEASRAERPDYAPLYYALSHLYAERGQLEPALEAARRAVDLDPDSAIHHYQAGAILNRMGRKRQALSHFIRVAEIGAPSEGVAFDSGVALFAASDFTRATLAFESAVAHNPRNARALDYLGACYRLKGWNDKAYEVYQRALALDPKDAIAHYGLGVLHIKRGDTETAARLLEHSLELDPESAYAHYKLGRLRMLQGDAAAAVASLEKAVALQPDLKNALYNLGLAYMRLGDEKRGQQALARFEELKKRDRPPLGEGGVSAAIPEDEL